MSQIRYEDSRHTLNELIETALSRRLFPIAPLFSVQLADRAVYLRGVVDSYYQKQLAQESIRSLCGSRQIHNELEVLPPAAEEEIG